MQVGQFNVSGTGLISAWFNNVNTAGDYIFDVYGNPINFIDNYSNANFVINISASIDAIPATEIIVIGEITVTVVPPPTTFLDADVVKTAILMPGGRNVAFQIVVTAKSDIDGFVVRDLFSSSFRNNLITTPEMFSHFYYTMNDDDMPRPIDSNRFTWPERAAANQLPTSAPAELREANRTFFIDFTDLFLEEGDYITITYDFNVDLYISHNSIALPINHTIRNDVFIYVDDEMVATDDAFVHLDRRGVGDFRLVAKNGWQIGNRNQIRFEIVVGDGAAPINGLTIEDFFSGPLADYMRIIELSPGNTNIFHQVQVWMYGAPSDNGSGGVRFDWTDRVPQRPNLGNNPPISIASPRGHQIARSAFDIREEGLTFHIPEARSSWRAFWPTLDRAFGDEVPDIYRVRIQYTVEIDPAAMPLPGQTRHFDNTVHLLNGHVSLGNATRSVPVTSPPLVEKGMNPDGNNVEVEIIINPNGIELNSGQNITLVDTMSSNLMFLHDSIRVYTMVTENAPAGESVRPWARVDLGEPGELWGISVINQHQFELIIPDSTAVRLVYDTIINALTGSEVEISNEVWLVGLGKSDEVRISHVVTNATGGAAANRRTVSVYKRNAENSSQQLDGAEFDLYAAVLEAAAALFLPQAAA